MNKKVTGFSALILAVVMMFLFCSCGIDTEEEVVKRASAIPQSKEEIFNYFDKAMKAVHENDPAVSYSLSQKARSPECENSDIKTIFPTIAEMMTGGKGDSTEYGEDCSAIFPENKLELNDIRSANIIDIDDPTSRSYTIVFTIWDESNPTQDDSTFGKLYKLTPKEEILEELKKGASLISVKDYEYEYQIGKITAVISKETDRLSELNLEREVIVNTEVTGEGTLAQIGTVPLSFRYSSTANYSVDWDNPETAEVE